MSARSRRRTARSTTSSSRRSRTRRTPTRPPSTSRNGGGGRAGTDMLTILFDGVAYGMLLFVLASGLSVTLGLMNFINLAHGAFAMVGGYVTALMMNRAGVPFLATLPAAFIVPAILGVALERTLYRRLYGARPLDQVLFTIGLVLMAMPIADFFLGAEPQQVNLPAWLSGSATVYGVGIAQPNIVSSKIASGLAKRS